MLGRGVEGFFNSAPWPLPGHPEAMKMDPSLRADVVPDWCHTHSQREPGYSNACYVGLGSSSPLRPTGGGETEERDVAEETPPRYCSVCRHELKPEDYLYCPKCGTPLILAAQVPTPEADRPVPAPPQPGAGAPGEPAHQQPAQERPAQEQLAQRGWWRRHPILSGGLGIIVVLFVFISVVGSLGGGGGGEESAKGGAGQEHKKSTRSFAGTASTDGLIVFRRYLDLFVQSLDSSGSPEDAHQLTPWSTWVRP